MYCLLGRRPRRCTNAGTSSATWPHGPSSATLPNAVWSWDITKLLNPDKSSYYYLYRDPGYRSVATWSAGCWRTPRARLAERLIPGICETQGIHPGQLTVHAVPRQLDDVGMADVAFDACRGDAKTTTGGKTILAARRDYLYSLQRLLTP